MPDASLRSLKRRLEEGPPCCSFSAHGLPRGDGKFRAQLTAKSFIFCLLSAANYASGVFQTSPRVNGEATLRVKKKGLRSTE
jgi:hypothetical protein